MLAFLRRVCYNNVVLLWPYRIMVSTPPSHGGNRGSNPLRVTILLFETRWCSL